MLDSIKIVNFTAFEKLDVKFSSGINIFIGENGTGKTHILKACYAACDIVTGQGNFAEKITNVFYPSGKQIGRLVKRAKKSSEGSLEALRKTEKKNISIKLSFSNHTVLPADAKINGSTRAWMETPIKAAYIPVKDMTANAPGFRSLYDVREVHFEEIYVDILRQACLPLLKGPADSKRKMLLEKLHDIMDGNVVIENEEFFLYNKQGKLEFTLLAEGMRKIGLLWLLLQNGTLLSGSVLFWDEPETNLNPKMMQPIIGILLELQRMGVQIFIATHDYVLLQEFDLQLDEKDKIIYHSLYRNKDDVIEVSDYSTYLNLNPNAIDEAFGSLIDREITNSMGSAGKK